MRARAMVMSGLVCLVCGCSSMFPVKNVDANKVATDFYRYNSGENRSTAVYVMEGTNMAITGMTRLEIRSVLPQVSMIPREPSFVENVTSVLPTLGLAAMGISAINKGPTVVEPAQMPTQVIEQPVFVK